EFLRSLQSLDVCNHLVGLDAETKMRGSAVEPFLDGRFLQQLAEREVHLDRVQLRAVMVQELRLSELFRIEGGPPAGIGPSRGADVELRHLLSSKDSADYTFRFLAVGLPVATLDVGLAIFARAVFGEATGLLWRGKSDETGCPESEVNGFTCRGRSCRAAVLFIRVARSSAWAAISRCSSFPCAATRAWTSGNFCFSLSTGANRSPNLSMRRRTSSASKTTSSGFFLLSTFSTSSQVTGVETVGWG